MDRRIGAIAARQFALDYNCAAEDFGNDATLVTPALRRPGTRKFRTDSVLSILSYRGKLVISADDALLPWCRTELSRRMTAQWGFEAQTLAAVDRRLREIGWTVGQAHLFFLPEAIPASAPGRIRWLSEGEIAALRADPRIDEAFLFEDYVEDVLGAALLDERGELLAVAGATANSDTMWEIGCNALRGGQGFGTAVVSALAGEIWRRGIVPYTGTAMSHIASQRMSLNAGFRPAFCELRAERAGAPAAL